MVVPCPPPLSSSIYSSVSKSSTFTEIVGLRGLSTPAHRWRLWCITCARKERLLLVFYSLACTRIPSSLSSSAAKSLVDQSFWQAAHEAGSLPVLLFMLFSNALSLPSLRGFVVFLRAFLFRLFFFMLSFISCSHGRSDIEK